MRRSHNRSRHVAAAATLSMLVLASFGALGGLGFAQSSLTSAQYQYGKNKVVICHKPTKKHGGKTIRVAAPAVPAHLRHGDTTGRCAQGAQAAQKAKGKAKSQSSKAKAKKTGQQQQQPAATVNHPAPENPGKGKGKGK